MGQELGVEALNEVGTILTQYGASWRAWPAEIPIKVQGAKEAFRCAGVAHVVVRMLICCHCCRQDRGVELIVAGGLLVDLLHIDGALIEHRLLHIARHHRVVLQQKLPIRGLYREEGEKLEGGWGSSYAYVDVANIYETEIGSPADWIG